MRIDVVTIFPQMIAEAVSHSILQRAQAAGHVQINVVNLRDYATDRHHTTDDTPCGGGGGMIMKVEPIARALDALRPAETPCRVILTDPQGAIFTQGKARDLSCEERLIFLCGHYEGVDERVRQYLVTDALSIGDYVLTGGELPALVMIDAIVRLLPGVLGEENAPDKDSFSGGLLEYPQYTRPRAFRGWEVPDILFSGHHAQIARWRRWHQLIRTRERRPDLWAKFLPSAADEKLLAAEEPKLEG
jgi:tRNA (guanine37-N1)-methyltransferase